MLDCSAGFIRVRAAAGFFQSGDNNPGPFSSDSESLLSLPPLSARVAPIKVATGVEHAAASGIMISEMISPLPGHLAMVFSEGQGGTSGWQLGTQQCGAPGMPRVEWIYE